MCMRDITSVIPHKSLWIMSKGLFTFDWWIGNGRILRLPSLQELQSNWTTLKDGECLLPRTLNSIKSWSTLEFGWPRRLCHNWKLTVAELQEIKGRKEHGDSDE